MNIQISSIVVLLIYINWGLGLSLLVQDVITVVVDTCVSL
jgi:hypothetical protein